MLKQLWKEEHAQDLTEYGLILVLVALVAVGVMQSLGGAILNAFNNAAVTLQGVTPK